MKNKMRKVECAVTGVKMDANNGEFTCYANVKNVVDHAWDMTMNGAFVDSINAHIKAGTMPDMFWMHNSYDLPVGVWLEMEEDEHGLKMRGRLSKTSLGTDIETLARDGALNKFSIGYWVDDEEWNGNFNELRKVHITEVSWVTRACNEESVLLDIKSKMQDGDLPTKRELEKLLVKGCELSNRQAKKIADLYNPEPAGGDLSEIKALLESITS